MTFEEYLAIPALNASKLKAVGVSPLYYLWKQTQEDDTAPKQVGRASHAAIFEPERFKTDFIVWPEKRNSNAWKAFRDAHAHQEILTTAQRDAAVAIAAAIRQHPVAAPLLQHGKSETLVQWDDSRTGRPCKARVDWLGGCLVDLKTTANLEQNAFARDAVKYEYPLQMAFYSDGVLAATGKRLPVKMITIQNKPPHDLVVYDIPDEVLDEGRDRYRQLMEILVRCEETNTWPGIAPSEQTLVLPDWAIQHTDVAITFGGEAMDT